MPTLMSAPMLPINALPIRLAHYGILARGVQPFLLGHEVVLVLLHTFRGLPHDVLAVEIQPYVKYHIF